MAIYRSDADAVYTDDAQCDYCGDRRNGYTFQCKVCDASMCPLHSCVDGCCPDHTRAGAIAVGV